MKPPSEAAATAVLGQEALVVLANEAEGSRDGLETGGLLLGSLEPPAHYVIRHVGGPGPAAIRQPHFFLRDLQHAQQLAGECWERDRSLWIGEWHTHPRGPARPSALDMRTYRTLLADPVLAFSAILSIVMTPRDSHGWMISAWSVTSADLIPAAVVKAG